MQAKFLLVTSEIWPGPLLLSARSWHKDCTQILQNRNVADVVSPVIQGTCIYKEPQGHADCLVALSRYELTQTHVRLPRNFGCWL